MICFFNNSSLKEENSFISKAFNLLENGIKQKDYDKVKHIGYDPKENPANSEFYVFSDPYYIVFFENILDLAILATNDTSKEPFISVKKEFDTLKDALSKTHFERLEKKKTEQDDNSGSPTTIKVQITNHLRFLHQNGQQPTDKDGNKLQGLYTMSKNNK